MFWLCMKSSADTYCWKNHLQFSTGEVVAAEWLMSGESLEGCRLADLDLIGQTAVWRLDMKTCCCRS